ncbi:Plug domain-containing protein [Pseudomonas sp. MAFF212427]|uniref:Plug domain-containing protein n=1 Tax=Pseudomonas brassicae TaxID=2708063 RepID=A0A6B3NPS6_9PSED|nr:Plug domain-containing protein [Pseudomonas brassicae]
MHQHHPIARGIGLGLLLAGTTAHADDTTPALKTVTVTAQHREESLQQVPVAVSAVQGTSITADGVRAMGDITTFIPNAAAKNPDGDGRPRWYIRGLGTGDTGAATVYPVGIYADDVYLNAPVAGGGTLVDERLAGRVSLYSEERDGFTHNLTNDQTYSDVNKKAVRVQFLAKLNPDLAALWKLHGRQFKGDGSSGSLPLGTYYNVGY